MEMPGLRRVTRDQNKTTCSGVNAGVEKKTRGTREEQAKVREDAENKKAAGDAMIASKRTKDNNRVAAIEDKQQKRDVEYAKSANHPPGHHVEEEDELEGAAAPDSEVHATVSRPHGARVAQKADDDGNPFVAGSKRSRTKAPRVKHVPESISDQEDDDFELPDLVDPSDSEGSDNEMDIDNEELASILLSKTVPARSMAAKSKAQTRGASTATTSARKRKQTADSASAPANDAATYQTVLKLMWDALTSEERSEWVQKRRMNVGTSQCRVSN
ncbi:hypothetical protein B0H10DRAFT_2440142 [Mycena sp. CBHHK59/15]|nr:hypothetical protein B0H10DRAFT_2440142 [Mycena sp. CBHHK59/15]